MAGTFERAIAIAAAAHEAQLDKAGAPIPIAREMKLADLRDNSDQSRIADPTEKDRARIEKYRSAIEYLQSLG